MATKTKRKPTARKTAQRRSALDWPSKDMKAMGDVLRCWCLKNGRDPITAAQQIGLVMHEDLMRWSGEFFTEFGKALSAHRAAKASGGGKG